MIENSRNDPDSAASFLEAVPDMSFGEGYLAKRLALACFLAVFLPAVSLAETRALLVGVSSYENEAIADLRGPRNDVSLLRDVLGARGVADIRLLADGVEGGVPPTRANIMRAFAELAENAARGDFIYIHLSGHGTQQPDPTGEEADGLDEVFLPSDTGRAVPDTGLIENAIVDDEIGAAVDAIRARGADVWLVMDSCHSGTGLRAASPRVAARFVDPETLGVRMMRPDSARESGLSVSDGPGAGGGHSAPDGLGAGGGHSASDGPEAGGGYIAFYSAQSHELAREVDFSDDGSGRSGWYGLFTAKLAARLQGHDALSFRQLFQAVLTDMNDSSIPGVARLQTPLWEGPLIDAAVFGGVDTVGVRRFAVTGDALAAGLVQGLGPGTLVALVPDAASPVDAVIGHAQLEAVQATRAFLRPVAAECVPRLDMPCATLGGLPGAARFAQVVARPVDLTIRLGMPYDMHSGQILAKDSPPVAALLAALEKANAGPGARLALSVETPDVETLWDGAALWLGISAREGDTPTGLSWRPDDGADLAGLLARIAEAETLARMLSAAGEGGSLLNPSPVRIVAGHLPARLADLARSGEAISPRRECAAALANLRGLSPAPLDRAAVLKQCDSLALRAEGLVGGARDVNRIHIDAKFCVHAAHARIDGVRSAHTLGADMVICSDCPDGYAAGSERLFVVVTETTANAEPLNLEGLVETCSAGGATTRGGAAAETRSFLERLARRPDTRGSFGGLSVRDIWVESWSWRVLPRREVFRRAEATSAMAASDQENIGEPEGLR